MRRSRLAVLRLSFGIGLCVVLGGCERGCLWRLIPRAGLKAVPGGPEQPSSAWFGMGEVDCPDGLARCRGGVVQVSTVARRPSPCAGNPESCACPWITSDPCAGACVADDVELAVTPDHALAQLCAPSAASVGFARPRAPSIQADPGPSATPSCEGEAFVCLGSAVVACHGATTASPELVGTCAAGCASDVSLGGPLAERLKPAQALALLCTR